MLEGFDEAGQRFEIDPGIVHPMSPEDFGSWAYTRIPRLPPQRRAEVGRFLLGRAEEARIRFLDGGAASRNGWLLGRFSAPYHFLAGYRWRATSDVPGTPFVQIRLWRLRWDSQRRLAGDTRVQRELTLAWPRVDG